MEKKFSTTPLDIQIRKGRRGQKEEEEEEED